MVVRHTSRHGPHQPTHPSGPPPHRGGAPRTASGQANAALRPRGCTVVRIYTSTMFLPIRDV
jgi:hypothetical protein